MLFQKIKDNGKRVELAWTTPDDQGGETAHVLSNRARPLPPFVGAMQAFASHVVRKLELDPEADITVTSIALNVEKKGGARGIVISCRMDDLEAFNSPWFFNTPHLRERPEGGENGAGYYDENLAACIAELEKQAELYKNGQREQAELFEKESEEEDDSEEE